MPLLALLAACVGGDGIGAGDPGHGRDGMVGTFDPEAADLGLADDFTPVVETLGEPDEDPALSAFLWEEGVITDLALEVSDEDMRTLESTDGVDVRATLSHAGEQWVVGLKIKGNMTRRGFAGKPSLKIDVNEWYPNQRFYGLRKLTLNNMVQDKSMLKEHVAYRFFRDRGVPAPRHGYVRLTINGQAYGLYGLVQSMDQQFIDAWWPDDDEGNLYEGGYGADLLDGRYEDFALQEEGVPADMSDLAALVSALDQATPETMMDTLEARFEIDPLLDALAIDLLSGNWDAYARAANNFLLYRAPNADKWHLVPWGQDQAFTDRYVPMYAGWEGRILTKCGESPECRTRLYARASELLGAWADLPGYAANVAQTISADCEADPRAEIGCSPDDVLGFLEERPEVVREELANAH